MKIESECYQIMKDNVSDLCHWPALCNAGATMSSPHRQTECFLAVSHTRLQIAQTSFNTAPPPTRSPRPFNTTHIVKLHCAL